MMNVKYFLFVLFLFFTCQNLFAQKWEWLLELDYNSLEYNTAESIFIAENENNSFAFSNQGEVILSKPKGYLFFTGDLNDYEKNYEKVALIIFEENEKLGFINLKGEVIIPAQYESLNSFSEGLAKFKKEGKYGFINLKGEEIIPAQYDKAKNFSEGLAVVAINEEVTYANPEGESIYKTPVYLYIDQKGNEVIDASKYTYVTDFDNGVAFGNVGIRNTKGYFMYSKPLMFDKTGQILGSRYNFFREEVLLENNLIPASFKGLYGYLNNKGKVIIDFQFYSAHYFSEGLAVVGIVPEEYQNLSNFEKWAYLRVGAINEQGEWVIEPKFQSLNSFQEGYAIGRDSLENMIVVDTKGEVLQVFQENEEGQMPYASSFENGYLILQYYDPESYKNKYKLLDKNFKPVFDNYFEEIIPATEKLFIVKENEKYGVIRLK